MIKLNGILYDAQIEYDDITMVIPITDQIGAKTGDAVVIEQLNDAGEPVTIYERRHISSIETSDSGCVIMIELDDDARPLTTQEDRIAMLEKENTELKERNAFIEDCIAEMAMLLYA